LKNWYLKIYATSIIKTKWIGLPLVLKNTSASKNALEGILQWRMHKSWQISSIVWKDKKPILLLSIHVVSILYFYVPVDIVPKRNIMASSMHLEYTIHMRCVDVPYQLKALYSM
jgi:hypothetical protein